MNRIGDPSQVRASKPALELLLHHRAALARSCALNCNVFGRYNSSSSAIEILIRFPLFALVFFVGWFFLVAARAWRKLLGHFFFLVAAGAWRKLLGLSCHVARTLAVAAGRVQTLLNAGDAQAVAAGRAHAMKAGRAQSLLPTGDA